MRSSLHPSLHSIRPSISLRFSLCVCLLVGLSVYRSVHMHPSLCFCISIACVQRFNIPVRSNFILLTLHLSPVFNCFRLSTAIRPHYSFAYISSSVVLFPFSVIVWIDRSTVDGHEKSTAPSAHLETRLMIFLDDGRWKNICISQLHY